ncbi:MAG: WbqC family protein [Burkholderiales bacterium]
MIVAIHQPHFIPWLGYLHRMAQVDLFIVLDHVQFERRNHQNRAQIRLDGEARWLTVPVEQHSQKELILDKRVDNRDEARPWGRSHFATLRHAYREAGHFGAYAPALKRILEARWERLADLDAAMLAFLMDAFSIRTRVVKSSRLAVDGAKSGLILNLCRAVQADALLAGFGGSRGYLEREEFARHGIDIRHHEFSHPAYRQCGAAPFIAGLAAVDLLFNAGAQSRALLLAESPCTYETPLLQQA